MTKAVLSRSTKPEMQELPGMEQREIEAIIKVAEQYSKIKEERISLTKLESQEKQNLIAVMRKHNKKVYNYRGLFVMLTEELGIKVQGGDKQFHTEEKAVEPQAVSSSPAAEPTNEERIATTEEYPSTKVITVSQTSTSKLTYENYLAYAKHMGVKSTTSQAKRWEITKEKDGLILAWLTEGSEQATRRITKKSSNHRPRR